MWCGVVWCGVVWCGVVWCGVVWCGVVWCGVVWCGVVWCGVVWCGVVWCGVVWCGVVWCGVVWCWGDNPSYEIKNTKLNKKENNKKRHQTTTNHNNNKGLTGEIVDVPQHSSLLPQIDHLGGHGSHDGSKQAAEGWVLIHHSGLEALTASVGGLRQLHEYQASKGGSSREEL